MCGCVSTASVLPDTNEDDSAAVRLRGMELFQAEGTKQMKNAQQKKSVLVVM